jgi:transcriptional regulator with XRE-family HTH domain
VARPIKDLPEAPTGASGEPESAHEPLEIGFSLRELRQSRRLSIRALAQAAGLTHSTIAQIEANRTGPSVSSMKRILSALGMSLSEFFAQAQAQGDGQMVFAADELVELADGTSLNGNAIMMLHERYAPGADTGEPYVHQGGLTPDVLALPARLVDVRRQRECSALPSVRSRTAQIEADRAVPLRPRSHW